MAEGLKRFLLSCSETDFGPVHLTDAEKEFYKEFNHEIVSLCNTLPQSIQTAALVFFMKYSGLSIGDELNFFKNFYVPSWSIVYWLIDLGDANGRSSQEDVRNAKTAHSMAMILHSLDDHISDKEIHASHLTLLLRSQSWMVMNHALSALAVGVDGGIEIVEKLIDEYYAAIWNPDEPDSLDAYCDLFRKQMATWLIVPMLLSISRLTHNGSADAIQQAYGSFGVAWRLLDDIMDTVIDIKSGAHSAIYTCLPANIRKLWDKNEPGIDASYRYQAILKYLCHSDLINQIKQRIVAELQSAAAISEGHDITGLARELRSLVSPLIGFH
jgi:hypothetical protein